MLIPAFRFSTLPEGCPVLVGDAALPGTIREPIGKGYRVAIAGSAPMAGGGTSTMIAWAPRMQVDLTTPAAVRAFAPALICAVQGLPAFARPLKEPAAVWCAGLQKWALVDHITGGDSVCSYQPGMELVTGPTPEACLLAGLHAALDAAKGAA